MVNVQWQVLNRIVTDGCVHIGVLGLKGCGGSGNCYLLGNSPDGQLHILLVYRTNCDVDACRPDWLETSCRYAKGVGPCRKVDDAVITFCP